MLWKRHQTPLDCWHSSCQSGATNEGSITMLSNISSTIDMEPSEWRWNEEIYVRKLYIPTCKQCRDIVDLDLFWNLNNMKATRYLHRDT